MEDWKSYIKLCSIPDIGSITAMRLLEAFGSPGAVFEASREALMSVPKIGSKTADAILAARSKGDCEKTFERMSEIGAKYIHYKDPRYPRSLSPLSDKPVGFYCIGDCDFNAPCISIVGSRMCSLYGQSVARKFAATFARAGFTVVSGMARGSPSWRNRGGRKNNSCFGLRGGCGLSSRKRRTL